MDFLTPTQMRAIDKNTEYNGIPTLVLMENAGSRISDYIVNNFPQEKTVSIYSGIGGNGGDGFVIARHLLNHDYKVKLFLLGRPEKIKNKDTLTNWNAIKVIEDTDPSFKLNIISDSSMLSEDDSDLIIDAIVGTGVNGKFRQPISSAIDYINMSKAKVLSVDIPSGVDPLTGKVIDKSIVSDITFTLHKAKTGLEVADSYAGQIIELDIGIPKASEDFVGDGDLLKINPPTKYSHKGDNGSVLIVGGNSDYVGAVIFAATACLSRQVDLVYIIVPDCCVPIIKQYNPSFIVRGVSGNYLTMDAYEDIMSLYERVDSILIGSGSGVEEETGVLFNKLIKNISKPLVLDADALKLVDLDNLNKGNVIVTPHKNEFKQLFGFSVPDNLEEVLNKISNISNKYDIIILLKGVCDIIFSPNDIKFNNTGNQGMTIGGTGDLLAGLTVALTTNVSLYEAAYIASFILGTAGDNALKNKGWGYNIEDIIFYLNQ